jgi:hypothetical protein
MSRCPSDRILGELRVVPRLNEAPRHGDKTSAFLTSVQDGRDCTASRPTAGVDAAEYRYIYTHICLASAENQTRPVLKVARDYADQVIRLSSLYNERKLNLVSFVCILVSILTGLSWLLLDNRPPMM